MGRITLYGVPAAVGDWIRGLLSGSLGDVLWKLLVLTVLVGIAFVLLVAMGGFAAAVGGILLATLVSDDVRALVANVWHRNWAEVKAPW
jgi:hypothetical protein